MPEPPDSLVCVVDTGVLIDFLRGHPYAASLFRRLVKEGEPAISAITHAEILAAARLGTEDATTRVLDGFITIAVSPAIARRAGSLLNQSRARNEDLGIADALIASTALELDLPLVTNDVDR